MSVRTEQLSQLRADPSGKKGHRWQISCLEFSPDSTRLASGSWDKEVRIWDLTTLSTVGLLSGAHHVPVTSVSWYQPTGGLLCAGAADCSASLWSSDNGSQLATLSGHKGWVLDVCFAYHASLLATASRDCTVQLWDPTALTTTGVLKHSEVSQWSQSWSGWQHETTLHVGTIIHCNGSGSLFQYRAFGRLHSSQLPVILLA